MGKGHDAGGAAEGDSVVDEQPEKVNTSVDILEEFDFLANDGSHQVRVVKGRKLGTLTEILGPERAEKIFAEPDLTAEARAGAERMFSYRRQSR